jgi:hypothetical protein
MSAVVMKRGRLIAKILEHSLHRATLGIDGCTGELHQIAPLLCQSGTAALAWRNLCHLDSGSLPFARELRQVYRLQVLQATLNERVINQLGIFLKTSGLTPLLGKGWAVARLYPEPALRPYGDFDLYVRPQDHAAAAAAFAGSDAPRCPVDLHCGSLELDDRSFDEVYSRSQLVRCGEIEVRIFGPEDHLRLLCVHMLHHGAWRPLWLYDVAVALESRLADFDWAYFLSGDPRRSDWVACAIGLAHQLLGAHVEGTPVEQRSRRLPRWLVPAILKQWGKMRLPDGMLAPMEHHLRHPRGALKALRLRWPNPIEATVRMGGRFNEVPRLLFQIRECLVRTMRFAIRLPGLLREPAI